MAVAPLFCGNSSYTIKGMTATFCHAALLVFDSTTNMSAACEMARQRQFIVTPVRFYRETWRVDEGQLGCERVLAADLEDLRPETTTPSHLRRNEIYRIAGEGLEIRGYRQHCLCARHPGLADDWQAYLTLVAPEVRAYYPTAMDLDLPARYGAWTHACSRLPGSERESCAWHSLDLADPPPWGEQDFVALGPLSHNIPARPVTE